jgi:hypothetical protein
MKKLIFLALSTLLSSVAFGQLFSIVAGDTSLLSRHQYFNPPEHIERIGTGQPIEYSLDVNLDGFSDITVKCDNSYGAIGYASNYITVKAVDSNDICYAHVDSSYCFNGYKPVYFAQLFNFGDTITNELMYSQNEIIINKEFWVMKDTCTFKHENIGAKFLAVRLNSHGTRGLAWVSLELYVKSFNGYSADIKETGFKSATTSIPENVFSVILIYPDPSSGFVNIDVPGLDGNLTATIFDLSGNEVLVTELNTKKTTLNLGNGTYLVKITDKNKSRLTRKIIVL